MAYQLPSDPHAIVIQWRTLDGLTGLRNDSRADLTIEANGNVTVGPRFNKGKTTTGKLTTPQLQKLLSLAIADNDFFSFDSSAIENFVSAKEKERKALMQSDEIISIQSGPPYADAGTTLIRIATKEKSHEARYHGLFAAARDNPEIKPLGQLRTIELALLSLAEKIVHSINE